MKRNIAIIMYGDSFRASRKQLEEKTGFKKDAQIENAQSVKYNLVEPLKSLGNFVKVFGVTYPMTSGSNFTDILPELYDNAKVIVISRSSNLFGGQINSIECGFNLVIILKLCHMPEFNTLPNTFSLLP